MDPAAAVTADEAARPPEPEIVDIQDGRIRRQVDLVRLLVLLLLACACSAWP